MSKLSINSVILKENYIYMDENRYNLALTRSKKSLYKVASFKQDLQTNKVESRAFEIARSYENKDLSGLEKQILISNLVFSDDKYFSNFCLSYGYNKQNLEQLNSLLKLIKKLPADLQDDLLKCKMINEINRFSQIYFGLNNTHVVINKVNQLLAKQPNILIKKK